MDTNTKAQDQGHERKCSQKKKRSSKIFFRRSSKKKKKVKKGLQKNFLGDLQKNGAEENISADLQNFNHSKNSAVPEPRTGQFLRT